MSTFDVPVTVLSPSNLQAPIMAFGQAQPRERLPPAHSNNQAYYRAGTMDAADFYQPIQM